MSYLSIAAEQENRLEAVEQWINTNGQQLIAWINQQIQREEQMQADLEMQKARFAKPKQVNQYAMQQVRQQPQQPQQMSRATQVAQQTQKAEQYQAANVYRPSNDPNDYVDDGLPSEDDGGIEIPDELPPLKSESVNDQTKKKSPGGLWNFKRG